MAKLSYHKFQNALDVLQKVYDHLGNDDLSKDERDSAVYLLKVCNDLLKILRVIEDERNG